MQTSSRIITPNRAFNSSRMSLAPVPLSRAPSQCTIVACRSKLRLSTCLVTGGLRMLEGMPTGKHGPPRKGLSFLTPLLQSHRVTRPPPPQVAPKKLPKSPMAAPPTALCRPRWSGWCGASCAVWIKMMASTPRSLGTTGGREGFRLQWTATTIPTTTRLSTASTSTRIPPQALPLRTLRSAQEMTRKGATLALTLTATTLITRRASTGGTRPSLCCLVCPTTKKQRPSGSLRRKSLSTTCTKLPFWGGQG
mmetsp:Transcript_24621/g.62124  ORF Transcript_24621/g.62124 Transcript_24621/m.62124 type:complete len:251 (+) Transcript_24621:117-869(+)